MKLKLFFIFILIGMSLQAQTPDSTSSDELDVVDELDVIDNTPAAMDIPNPPTPITTTPAAKKEVTPAPVATPTAVVIPRVYQILMPSKKQHEVTPSIMAVGLSAEDNRFDDIQYMNSVVQTGIGYVYGIGNNQSIGAELSYLGHVNRVTVNSVETSQKKGGFGNPAVHYKGLVNIAGISFYGYAGYSFKLEKETMDTDKKEGNAANGQNRLNLTFGGYKAVGSDYIFGALVNYNIAEDGESMVKSGSNSQTFKLSKGDRMTTSIFMEVQNDWHPNIALNFYKGFSTITTDEFDNKSYSANSDGISLAASGQFQTAENIYFIPEASYSVNFDNDYFKKYHTFTLYGGLRLLF